MHPPPSHHHKDGQKLRPLGCSLCTFSSTHSARGGVSKQMVLTRFVPRPERKLMSPAPALRVSSSCTPLGTFGPDELRGDGPWDSEQGPGGRVAWALEPSVLAPARHRRLLLSDRKGYSSSQSSGGEPLCAETGSSAPSVAALRGQLQRVSGNFRVNFAFCGLGS